MLLDTKSIDRNLIPYSYLAEIETADNSTEEIVVDPRLIVDGRYLIVSSPLDRRSRDSALLVELPQETARGHWRIWVHKRTLHENDPTFTAAAE